MSRSCSCIWSARGSGRRFPEELMRAQVVLLRGDRILLARHERPGHTYWVLPGGAVEEGETPEEAAVREVREETGLEVQLTHLLFTQDPQPNGDITIGSRRYTYLGEIVGGTLCQVEDRDGGSREKGYLAGVQWLRFDERVFDAATADTLRRV